MVTENLRKVSENCKKEGLNLAKPLSEKELVEKFANLGILLSQDVIEVYSNFGGFDEDKMDSECLTFWTPEKILQENESNAEYVFFADFLIDSHHYAFKFQNVEISSIYVCYSETDRIKISNSFAEFFELYLNQIEKLFV